MCLIGREGTSPRYTPISGPRPGKSLFRLQNNDAITNEVKGGFPRPAPGVAPSAAASTSGGSFPLLKQAYLDL